MGFISWKTADTQESISNIHVGLPQATVYMLQPSGTALAESAYEGYGVFGGIDAYLWLLRVNADHIGITLSELNDDQQRELGISLECGDVCRDSLTGEYWHICNDDRKLVPGKFANVSWDDIIPEYGASSNQLLEMERFECFQISDVVELRFHLKFSFNKNAVYEELPRSESCSQQGYFLDM